MFLDIEDKFGKHEFKGTPPMSALKRGTPIKGENWTNNPSYLENGKRLERKLQLFTDRKLHTGFHWYQNW